MNRLAHLKQVLRYGAILLLAILLAVLAALYLFPAREAASLPKWSEPEKLIELTIDLNRLQEPNLDASALKSELDALTETARKRVETCATVEEKLAVLVDVLFRERGAIYLSNVYWRDSTLAAALLRKRGNCVASTTLFVVVGRRLGLPIFPVVIPEHIYARYFDGENSVNVETTSPGVGVSEQSYRRLYDWRPEDAESMGYGINMSEKQFTAVVHSLAARHHSATGNSETALEEINKSMELWPDNVDFMLQKASYTYTGRADREATSRMLGEVLIAGNTERIRARVSLIQAQMLKDQEEYEEALAILKQAYGTCPKSMEYRVLSSMSVCYRSMRNFQNMLLVDELAAILHGTRQDLVGLAIAYKNAREIEAAIAALRVALAENPEDWNARVILAGYLIRAGEEDEGWKTFESIKKPRENERLYETNMAWFYGSIGEKKEFLQHLENALKLDPGSSVLSYAKREVDFDRYRDDEDFRALLSKYARSE